MRPTTRCSRRLGVNFQDYYTSEYYGLDDADSNAFLLRSVLPHKLFGKAQILRGTLPIVTSPDVPPSGDHTDVGDLNLFDVFMFKAGKIQIGIGPQLTAPTAGRDETGTGKWQAGLATLVIAPQKWGLVGGSSPGSTRSPGIATEAPKTTCSFSPW